MVRFGDFIWFKLKLLILEASLFLLGLKEYVYVSYNISLRKVLFFLVLASKIMQELENYQFAAGKVIPLPRSPQKDLPNG